MKQRLFFLLILLSPQVAFANPAIYAPQICSMMRTGISYEKAWGYIYDARKKELVDRERRFGGFNTDIGVYLSAGVEAKRELGGMESDVYGK